MQSALPEHQAGKKLPAVPGFSAPAASAASVLVSAPDSTGVPEEDPLSLNIEGDGELLREFCNESHEHLQNIEQGVLKLEENPTDADTLNSIFRAFHTFKGGSGFLNLRPINKLAHELESLLDLARQHKLSIDSDIIDIILKGGDTLTQFVAEMEIRLSGQKTGEPILIPTQSQLARIQSVVHGESSAPKPIAAHPPSEQPAQALSAAVPQAAPPASPAKLGQVVSSPAVVVEAVVNPASPAKPNASKPLATASASGPAPVSTGATSVKVDTLKLDSLVDLVGEMVIAQSMVAQDPSLTSIQSQQLTRNMAQLGRITKDLQRVSMSLRMVPVRSTFQKMTRLVRDLSVKAGKQVELEMSGEDTELDRTIVEEIGDPLVHMVRNSVDHGIENAEIRLSRGKAPYGTVSLRAYHQGGNIVIEIRDDGGGLNRDRILNKAIQQGLVKPDENLSDKEIFNFIFAAGFSTADKVTDISGRGVGMDVVRRNIDKLRGKIEIESTLGKGTRFSIYLPLTLAIIDGLIVGVGPERYIVPTLSVRESFRPTADILSTVHERGEMVNVRGRLIPMVRLSEMFNVAPKSTEATESIAIVVETDSRPYCLIVDQLIGKQEVVIKSLGETFKANPGLAGAAILGDGRVGLILDIVGLIKLGRRSPLAKAA
ncbi:MAG: chemotaxis protein CheA [Pedosphaera sp.]|nr:chemotaxis protein CheA [Pedosphaera sp.]